MNELPAAGRLLVAAPLLLEPTFSRTVVLLLDHDEGGALGIVLNRPSDIGVEQVLQAWRRYADDPPVIFGGGPVAPDNALALAALRALPGGAEPPGCRPVSAGLGLVDLDTPPELLAGEIRALRIFAGYAGWGAGQLEGELAMGAWYVVDSEPADAFTAAPETLWRRVLRRQRGTLAFVSTYPLDPRLN